MACAEQGASGRGRAPPLRLVNADFGRARMMIERGGVRSIVGEAVTSIDRVVAATAWLAGKMVTECTPLRAGDIVMTGAIIDAVALSPRDRVEVQIDRCAPVSVTLLDR
jgi:2-keto-4-pentenoate hydratase